MGAPRLLVTGFGPFPGAPENPTEALARALAEERADTFGAGAFHAVALSAEYSESWKSLEALFATFEPDVVVHFGLATKSTEIRLERLARNRASPGKPDARGNRSAPRLADDGPATLAATFPAEAALAALTKAGLPVTLSDDAGDYVCNATLYRSLYAAPPTRRVGFVHVPPERVLPATELRRAAAIILRTATPLHDPIWSDARA